MNEVEILLKLSDESSSTTPSPTNMNRIGALCRSGVVMLSGHIEGYIEELGALALDRIYLRRVPKKTFGPAFRYYLSRDMIRNIQRTTQPENIERNVNLLLVRDRHIWDQSSAFDQPLRSDIFLDRFANPKHERISALWRQFGFNGYDGGIASNLTTRYTACKNMIDLVVDQRNKIAHGDMVTTATSQDLRDMVRLVREYCRAADVCVGDWFRAQGCPIR